MGTKILEDSFIRKWYIVCGRGKSGKTSVSAGIGLRLADTTVCNDICRKNCDCKNVRCDLNCPCMRENVTDDKFSEMVCHKPSTMMIERPSSDSIDFNDKIFVDQDINVDTQHNQKYSDVNVSKDEDNIEFRDELPDENPNYCSKCLRKILLVSLDQQDNLSETFQTEIETKPTRIKNNFYVMELNRGAIAQIKENDENNVTILKSIRSLPGVLEALYFSEIIKIAREYDTIIIDTWPSFNTLNFLSFPKELNSLLNKIIGMDKLKNLDKAPFYQKIVDAASTIEKCGMFLKKSAECSFILVFTPEMLSITEANKLITKLAYVGISVNHLLINQVLRPKTECEICTAIETKQQKALERVKNCNINQIYLDFEPNGVRGVTNLERFSRKFAK
ncbi:Putative arsenite-translocating ATPase [Trachipleistophora hominis]|uniref:Putative arsenite-translocating ATPase n=1 Tax=Trachipleistophora hominis TaxID=72359 RepID=L7JWR1_TRAHO|nr:Putative arsenite-translocating ATPase [Trachipleistophora hominis]